MGKHHFLYSHCTVGSVAFVTLQLVNLYRLYSRGLKMGSCGVFQNRIQTDIVGQTSSPIQHTIASYSWSISISLHTSGRSFKTLTSSYISDGTWLAGKIPPSGQLYVDAE